MGKSLKILNCFSILIFVSSFSVLADWYNFHSKEFGFNIEFPEKPITSAQENLTELGNLKINYVGYEPSIKNKNDNIGYLVSFTEYPIEKVNSDKSKLLELIYRSAIDASIENVGGKSLGEKIAFVHGYQGRDVKIQIAKDNTFVSMRVVLVRNKMYMIQVFTKASKVNNKSIRKFIDSFKIC